MFKLALGAALISLASVQAAHAEEWRRVGIDGPVEVAVDIDSFSGPQNQRAARTLLVPRQAGDAYDYAILDVRIDCAARTISAVGFSAFDLEGALLTQADLPPATDAVRETDGTATVANAVCDGAQVAGQSFESANAFAVFVVAKRAG